MIKVMPVAIEVSNLWKEYRLGVLSHGSLGEDLRRLARRVTGRPPENEHEDSGGAYWALKGVDFSLEDGEVLGIIGKNGAGKSTLLKVLSRITSPTEGSIRIRGRMASLLEVGTGFHPERYPGHESGRNQKPPR